MPKSKDTKDEWRTYEAHLTDVYFEWPEPFPDTTKEESESTCRSYLDTFVGDYTMQKFYLKERDNI